VYWRSAIFRYNKPTPSYFYWSYMSDFKQTETFSQLNATLGQTAASVVKAPQTVDHLQHLMRAQSMLQQSATTTPTSKKLGR